jgi:hypothetical protein
VRLELERRLDLLEFEAIPPPELGIGRVVVVAHRVEVVSVEVVDDR